MTEQTPAPRLPLERSEAPVAALGALSGFAALVSAAACCVLPLAFALAGFGAGAFAAFVPWHWPLTIASAVAVATGWGLYWRRHRRLAAGSGCAAARQSRATFALLTAATLFVALSAVWKVWFETPLQAWLITL